MMKTIKILALVAVAMMLGCDDPGTTKNALTDNKLLPPELKDMRVYTVATDNGVKIYVAILDGKVLSATQPSDEDNPTKSTVTLAGKNDEGHVVLVKPERRIIDVTEVVAENDSMIVCRK